MKEKVSSPTPEEWDRYISELLKAKEIVQKKGSKESTDILQRHINYAQSRGTIDDLVDPADKLLSALNNTRIAYEEIGDKEKAAAIGEEIRETINKILKKDDEARPRIQADAKLLREIGADNAAEILEKEAVKSRLAPSGTKISPEHPVEDLFWKDACKAYLQNDKRFDLLGERMKTAVINKVEGSTQ